MDECPRHRERRESVALRGPEQLVKRCVGRAPAKADQYAEGGIEDAAALHVQREMVLAKSPRSNLGSCCVGIISGTTELASRVSPPASANNRPVGLI